MDVRVKIISNLNGNERRKKKRKRSDVKVIEASVR